jgi:hypothetical protein
MRRLGGVSKPIFLCTTLILVLWATSGFAEPLVQHGEPLVQHGETFPRALESYEEVEGIWSTLRARVNEEPFNFVATLIFLLAIVHTFLTARFLKISHRWAHDHEQRIERDETSRDSVHHGAQAMHFLGEVEVVFGLWAVVVVIMTLAATRPILRLAEGIIKSIARMFGGSLAALWFTAFHRRASSARRWPPPPSCLLSSSLRADAKTMTPSVAAENSAPGSRLELVRPGLSGVITNGQYRRFLVPHYRLTKGITKTFSANQVSGKVT